MQMARLAFWAVLLSAMSARGEIVGSVVSIGFPSVGGQGADLVRAGAWVPVVVDLTLENEASFEGWIRISQPDKDGDLCFDIQKCQLMRDGPRRFFLYALANPPQNRASAFSIEVLGSGKERVKLVSREDRSEIIWALTPAQPPEVLASDDFLVLSVSSGTAGKVTFLEGAGQSDRFSRRIRVAHIDPQQLPTRWQGLEAVDAVVWDDANPDPSVITRPRLEALLEWTRQGGLLVLAAGHTADALARDPLLNPALPVDLGPVVSTAALPRLRRNMLGLESGSHYRSPIPVVTCTTRPGATTVIREDDGQGFQSTIIARRRLERGRVVFVASLLSDIFADKGDPVKFFKRVLELRSAKLATGFETVELFGAINGWIGFKQIGATYLAVAMLVAGAYIFVATGLSWQFLRSRGWLKHSWSAFAVVASATSVLCVIGVQGVRGVDTKLVQLSVVDATAGATQAHATAYFGLRTPVFRTWDVWLPSDYPQVVEPQLTSCFLKPLSANTEMSSANSFADPKSYRLVPSRAELLGVPIRGTLKQFEGRWSGSMSGRIVCDIRLVPGPGGRYDLRVATDSIIRNELGVDLHRCFLIYAARDVFMEGQAEDAINQAEFVYLFPLGPLPEGETLKPSEAFVDAAGDELEFDQWKDLRTLARSQKQWAARFRSLSLTLGGDEQDERESLEQHETALMLLSFLDEYEPPIETAKWRFGTVSFAATGCRHLDLSSLLDRNTALFIGFARHPGPVNLCTKTGGGDYERIEPSETLTMYRILIPLES